MQDKSDSLFRVHALKNGVHLVQRLSRVRGREGGDLREVLGRHEAEPALARSLLEANADRAHRDPKEPRTERRRLAQPWQRLERSDEDVVDHIVDLSVGAHQPKHERVDGLDVAIVERRPCVESSAPIAATSALSSPSNGSERTMPKLGRGAAGSVDGFLGRALTGVQSHLASTNAHLFACSWQAARGKNLSGHGALA